MVPNLETSRVEGEGSTYHWLEPQGVKKSGPSCLRSADGVGGGWLTHIESVRECQPLRDERGGLTHFFTARYTHLKFPETVRQTFLPLVMSGHLRSQISRFLRSDAVAVRLDSR